MSNGCLTSSWEVIISLVSLAVSIYVFIDSRNRNEMDKFFKLLGEWQREKEQTKLISIFSSDIIYNHEKGMKYSDASLGRYFYSIGDFGIILRKEVDMFVDGKQKFDLLDSMYSGMGKKEHEYIDYDLTVLLPPCIQKLLVVYDFIIASCAKDSVKNTMRTILKNEISDQESFAYSVFVSNYILADEFKSELRKSLKSCLLQINRTDEKYVNLDKKKFGFF